MEVSAIGRAEELWIDYGFSEEARLFGSLALTEELHGSQGLTMEVQEDQRELPFSRELADEVHTDLINHLVNKEAVDPELAPLVVENALVFLDALAKNPGIVLSPSRMVDAAWHRFIVHTEHYKDYCDKNAGRFLHHRPGTNSHKIVTTPDESYEVLSNLGYEVDKEVWAGGADCDGGCDGGGGGGGGCDGGCDGI